MNFELGLVASSRLFPNMENDQNEPILWQLSFLESLIIIIIIITLFSSNFFKFKNISIFLKLFRNDKGVLVLLFSNFLFPYLSLSYTIRSLFILRHILWLNHSLELRRTVSMYLDVWNIGFSDTVNLFNDNAFHFISTFAYPDINPV